MKKQSERGFASKINKTSRFIIFFAIVLAAFSATAYAAPDNIDVPGTVCEFNADVDYVFSEAKTSYPSDNADTYGNFFINGKVSNISTQNGVPSYKVDDGNLEISYIYGNSLLNAPEESWRLTGDRINKINGITLDSDIMHGALLLQTSKDGKDWVNTKCITNVFADKPIRVDSLYSTTDIELINGCYYRLIVAYETQLRLEPDRFWFITIDRFDYKRYAEVYEFYAYTDDTGNKAADPSQTYSLGSAVRTAQPDGYSAGADIKEGDDHYGWDLGSFFVSGYTDKVETSDGDAVFLKNPDDEVTLWFNLKENINAIQGNKKLKITADTDGYDSYFKTAKTDFGRGTLIVRYTDYNNVAAEPMIYTNYLEANAATGEDTKVQLFGEGDYEVALDYQLTNDKLFDTVGHYRIFFKFSVRNANCEVYPVDAVYGIDLSESPITKNGFRLDLAKSRYLDVSIKREVLNDGADDIVEDSGFDGRATDDAEYIEEGIYTITVKNQYTNQVTVKRMFVGVNEVLKAHLTTGLSVKEINIMVADGAVIEYDGTIKPADAREDKNDPGNNGKVNRPGNNGAAGNSRALNPAVLSTVIILCVVAVFSIVIVTLRRKKEK